MSSQALDETQAEALFDILVHSELYGEVEGFKSPKAIREYGPPFQADGTKSTSPILQTLFTKLLLPLPGLNAVTDSLWSEKTLPLIEALSEANLSESYDKGVLGQRKTLATAISVLLEYPTRGYFGGYPKRKLLKENGEYDENDPEDLAKAWKDFLQGIVHGDLLDQMFAKVTESDQLSEHPSIVRAAHRFIVVK